MPGPLAGWAAGLELSGLPDAVALSARQFLQRATDLDPAVRRSLGERLAGQVASQVSPAPPPGTPPESYLAAVLAERRRRAEARLTDDRPRPPIGPAPAPPPPAPVNPPTRPRDPDNFVPPT
jgi:hypothetical protein